MAKCDDALRPHGLRDGPAEDGRRRCLGMLDASAIRAAAGRWAANGLCIDNDAVDMVHKQ